MAELAYSFLVSGTAVVVLGICAACWFLGDFAIPGKAQTNSSAAMKTTFRSRQTGIKFTPFLAGYNELASNFQDSLGTFHSDAQKVQSLRGERLVKRPERFTLHAPCQWRILLTFHDKHCRILQGSRCSRAHAMRLLERCGRLDKQRSRVASD